MQDKELDHLFRSNLNDFEAEPSDRVWAGVKKGIQEDHQRKSFVPLMRIAASVAILITAGLFILVKEQTPVITPGKKLAGNILNKVKQGDPATSSIPILQISPQTSVQPQASFGPSLTVSSGHHKINLAGPITKETAEQPGTQQPALPDQPQIAALATPAINNNPVVPDINTPLIDRSLNSVQTPATVVAAINPAKVETEDTRPAAVKKHRIRGLGGLLNAAIGVVDRRPDKIIEFTNNDDGDTITGINLGIVSIKKNK